MRIFKRLFYIGFILSLGILSIWYLKSISFFKYNTQITDNQLLEEYREIPENLRGKYDSLHPCQTEAKLIKHTRAWAGEDKQNFEGNFLIATRAACQAEQKRENLSEPSEINNYWQKVYRELIRNDYAKMPKIYAQFAQIKKEHQLDYRQFAQMLMNFIQNIPYILIHPNSCAEDSKRNNFSKAYHQEKRPCLPFHRFGLQTPTEFMFNLKADCDTRVMFAYMILTYFGYDVVILGSSHHAMLGINILSQGNYLSHQGKKYYFWETTGQGFSLGTIPPEYQNDDWKISLGNR